MRNNHEFGENTLPVTAEASLPLAANGEELSVEGPRHGGYVIAKGVAEWLLALGMFLLVAPLVLVLAAAVKLTSPGPAFYSQMRLGRNGRHYRMYKLRTMVRDAEAGTGPVWAARRDSRVTRLGGLLRRTHLDELPQLWNVLRGDMCLIGPRPERPELASKIECDLPAYRGRLKVRPGITGLAQMLAPADDPTLSPSWSVRKKLAHDLFYVREVSFPLDLRIALATPCHFVAEFANMLRHRMLHSYDMQVDSRPNAGILPADAAAAATPREESWGRLAAEADLAARVTEGSVSRSPA